MPKKALIIDDEEALNDIISEVLNTIDFTSYAAKCGEDALIIAKDHNYFDLINYMFQTY